MVGFLKEHDLTYKQSNQTWFYPDSTIQTAVFYENIKGYDSRFVWEAKLKEILTITTTIDLLFEWIKVGYSQLHGDKTQFADKVKTVLNKQNFEFNEFITRAELAVLLDHFINPFEHLVDMEGNWEYEE